MSSHIFDDFDRSEFSDAIFAVLGRALTISTRFDASTKVLARLSPLKSVILIKSSLSEEDYDDLVSFIFEKFKNLNNAINALGNNVDVKSVLTKARKSRNEFIHEATLGFNNGFDRIGDIELSLLIERIKYLVLNIIRGDILISTIISMQSKEPISDYIFSEKLGYGAF